MALEARNYVQGTDRAVLINSLVEKQTPFLKLIFNDVKQNLSAGDNLSLSIKIPGRGHIVEGVVKAADFLVKTNALLNYTLTKKTSPAFITELDESGPIEAFKAEVADPIAETFATDINERTYKAIIQGVDSAIVVDTAGGASFRHLSDATANVRNSRVSGKVSGAMNPLIMSQVRMSGHNQFTGGNIAGEIYRGFDIENFAGVPYVSSPDATDVIYPSSFPSSISGVAQNGSKTLPLASATTVDIPAGVLFTIDGVNRVDAEGNVLISDPKVFVTEFTPAGSYYLNIKTQMVFTPTMDSSGNNLMQVKNLSALPESGAAISLIGSLGVTYMTGVVFSEKIAVNINRPLSEGAKAEAGNLTTTAIAGMNSIQVWRRPDLDNGDTKYSVSRLDVQAPLMGIGGTAIYVRKS